MSLHAYLLLQGNKCGHLLGLRVSGAQDRKMGAVSYLPQDRADANGRPQSHWFSHFVEFWTFSPVALHFFSKTLLCFLIVCFNLSVTFHIGRGF